MELDYGMKMEIPKKEYLIPFGKAKIVHFGKDLTLVAHSSMVNLCIPIVKEFKKKGIEIELIDLRTIKPLDIATILASVRRTHFCVLVEEGHQFAGITGEIGFQIQQHCFDFLDAPVYRVCQRETPLPYSKVLEAASIPNKERIRSAIEETLYLRS